MRLHRDYRVVPAQHDGRVAHLDQHVRLALHVHDGGPLGGVLAGLVEDLMKGLEQFAALLHVPHAFDAEGMFLRLVVGRGRSGQGLFPEFFKVDALLLGGKPPCASIVRTTGRSS